MPLSTRLLRDCYVESPDALEICHKSVTRPKNQVEELQDKMDEATRMAAEIVSKAKLKADQIRTESYQQGYNEGLERSTLEGQEITEQARIESEKLLAEIERHRVNTLEELTDEIQGLVIQITEKVILAELSQGVDVTTNLVKTAINEVKSREKVHIFINQKDLARVEQVKNLLNTKLERTTVELLVDPLIVLGGCRIHTEKGWVDATLDNQLKELKELLISETG